MTIPPSRTVRLLGLFIFTLFAARFAAALSPTITWQPSPAKISYGTPLSSAQLDAVSDVPGTFAYTPALGTVLTAGIQPLSAVFTPADTVNYTSITVTSAIFVTGVRPGFTWKPNPARIVYGTPITAAQLDATSDVAGTFVYQTAPGTVVGVGTHYLFATFTPVDTVDYITETVSADFYVSPARPTVTWAPSPAKISYGTPLSAAQLDAVADVPGTFAYTPALGTVLTAGIQTLSVVFTPADSVDYDPVTVTSAIFVTGVKPSITWLPSPASIPYGTPLSAGQLDATSTVPGTFTYTPAFGTVLTPGTQLLTVVFAPTDTTDFLTVTAKAALVVTNVNDVLSWNPAPSTIPYGTPLSAAQLDAASTIPGTFAYTPALGTILTAGPHLLSAVFTPADIANYPAIATFAPIVVTSVAPTITWLPNPATIPFGSAITAAQLDATSSTPGTFAYTPAVGAILGNGLQTLTAVFTPTDTTDFTSVTSSASITVSPLSLTALSSVSAILGDPAKTITLTGSGFLPTATVQVNGTAIPTTFISTTSLSAIIPASYFLTVQTLQVSVLESAQNLTSQTLAITITAPLVSIVFTGPSTISPGSQQTLTFQLTNPYPVDLTATFNISFQPASGLPSDPTILFTNGTQVFTADIPANSTSSPVIQFQSGTIAGTITITLTLEAGGVNITPATVQPLVISMPVAVPAVTSVQMNQNGNTLTVITRGFSNTRQVSAVKFHFTPVAGASISTQDVSIDVDSLFNTYYGSSVSTPYGSAFTYTQVFNLNNNASDVGQTTVVLTNSVGASPAASTP